MNIESALANEWWPLLVVFALLLAAIYWRNWFLLLPAAMGYWVVARNADGEPLFPDFPINLGAWFLIIFLCTMLPRLVAIVTEFRTNFKNKPS